MKINKNFLVKDGNNYYFRLSILIKATTKTHITLSSLIDKGFLTLFLRWKMTNDKMISKRRIIDKILDDMDGN